MRISIIIPSYNSAHTLPHLLEAIPHDDDDLLEVLVVDSSESSIHETIAGMIQSYGKARAVHLGKRTIPALARNIGAEASSGELLVFVDSDVYPAPGWLGAIKSAYRDGYRVGGGSIDLPPFQVGKMVETAQYYLQFNEFLPVYSRQERKFTPSCNLFCERLLFESVGGFPDIRASEDVLFGLEVSKQMPMLYLPGSRVYHIFGTGWQRLFSNQKLLGEYVSIYRTQVHGGLFYSKVVQYLLSPLILPSKVFLLTSRLVRTNTVHFRRYCTAFPVVLLGLLSWTRGYVAGIANSGSVLTASRTKRQDDHQ